MQRGNFNSQTYHFKTLQNHQFPSQIPQNPLIYNPLNPPQNPQFQPSKPPLITNHPPPHYLFSPDYEQKLRDEVIYLHSLWHRGPSSSSTTLNPNLRTPHFLKPSISTPFKKTKKLSKTLETHLISDKEWPVESLPKCPPPGGPGWPEFEPNSSKASRPATAQERERVLALKIQLKGLDSCRELFYKEGGSDYDDEEEEEEHDGDDVEYELLMKVFEEDDELRGYYKKNCENGEFYCLVCGVIANKVNKKYANCVALVQHSVTILKTKKRHAHRAYGHVICKVLGWDINGLPSLPSTVGDASDQSLGKSCELQSESKINADGCDVDDHGGLEKDVVYCNSENVHSEQNNAADPAWEVANEMREGYTGSGGKSVDCGLSCNEVISNG